MERLGTVAPAEVAGGYVRWEEVNVSSDKGRREVRYYLYRSDGGSDLAVIGKEKSLRHMSYYYAIKNRSLLLSLLGPSYSSNSKLKCRREVVDWLNSIVSGSQPHESPHPAGSWDSSDASELNIETVKDIQSRKLGHWTKEFLWLGSSWTCRKKRKHYQSFRRNGVKISVDDFVYVLAEENKRLVAYLEDMYEDPRGNKMVVVRWFHKNDEVGFVLPHNFNDREIFFSLCLQDLSIECIDGLATVLSPQHFEKFLNEARHTGLVPFVCHKKFENDDVKPFDITQVKGYWKQEILRYMFTISPPKDQANSQLPDDGLKVEGNVNDATGVGPRKRHCQSKGDGVCAGSKEPMGATCVNVHNLRNSLINCKIGTEMCSLRGGESAAFLPMTEARANSPQYLNVGSPVEVLAQDSGIRGCWFRATIIKKHKDKIKVRYEDISDAADEASKLQEWILASRVADPDQLGLRIYGRTTVRPSMQICKDQISSVVDVGTAVEVWRHDGWWEGVVVLKESEDRIHIYFPGEKQESVFGCADLRLSQEWLGNGWMPIKARPDVVNSMPYYLETEQVAFKSDESKVAQASVCDTSHLGKLEAGHSDSSLHSGNGKGKENLVVPDLLDDLQAQLRWRSSKKRRRGSGSSGHKMHHIETGSKSFPEVTGSHACERFLILKPLKIDHENCKYIGDSPFSSTVVQPLTSLVMSR